MTYSIRLAAFAFVSLLIAGRPGDALAAEINVTGDCTLRDAIRAANSDSPRGDCPAGNGADTIILEGGTSYVLWTPLGGTFTLPTLSTPITIESSVQGTRASINARSGGRVLRIDGAAVTLRDITLTGGFLNGIADAGGAGVLVTDGTLDLIDSVVTSNTVSRGQREGGGIKLVDSHMNAIGSSISRNDIVLENTPFANAQHGGQIAMFNSTAHLEQFVISGDPEIPGLTFGDRVAFRGGGLYLDNSHVTMELGYIANVRIGDGSVGPDVGTRGFGVDMYLLNGSSAELTNVTIFDPFNCGDEQSRIYALDSDLVFNHVSLLACHNGITLENASTMEATNSLFMTRASNADFCRRIIAGQPAPFVFGVNSGNRFPVNGTCPPGAWISPNDWGQPGDYGGDTLTLPLAPSGFNPAVGAGDPAFCAATDQRGRPRDVDCDAGAFELLEQADLGVSLVLETPPPYYNGQSIEYSFTVSNGGPAPAYGIDASVQLQGLDLDSIAGPHDCTGTQCSIDFIADNGETVMTVRATVNTTLAGGTSFDATAFVDGDATFSFDPNLANNTSNFATGGSVTDAADLSIRGEILTPPPYSNGQTVVYEQTITNHGPALATAVTTSHAVQGLDAQGYTGPCNSSTASSCVINGLIAGDSRTVQFSAEVTGAEIVNEVSVGSDLYDPEPDDNSFEMRNTTAQDADLSVALDLLTGAPFFPQNQIIEYRIRVRNAGPDPAIDVRIDNQVERVFFIGADSTCSAIPCTIPLIPAGQSAETVWTGFFTDAGQASHAVQVYSDQNDPVTEDNFADIATTVNHAIDIGISSVQSAQPPIHALADFEIVVDVFNGGTATSDDVLVEITELDNLTVMNVWGTRCFDFPCALDYLEFGVGTAERMTLTLRPNEPGPFSMTLSANGPVLDPFPNNNDFVVEGTALFDLTEFIFVSGFE